MPNPGVKVQIEGDDRGLTGAVDRINKRLEKLRAPAERVQRSLSRFGQLTGINQVGTGLNRIGGYAKQAFFSLGRMVPALGALTGAASIAGVLRLTTAWAEFGSRLGFVSQRIGISSSRLQALDGAAQLAGSSAGSLQSGLQTLGQGMWDAVGGRDPALMSAFRALHVNFQNVDGSAKSVTEVMPQLADKIAGIRDPYAQAAVATAFFGGATEDLLPFLRLGSAGIARYTAMAAHYGVTNQAGVAAANRLRMAQVELTLATKGLGNSIAQSLEPVITPIVHAMAAWIGANREWIASKIAYYVQQFAGWLRTTWPEVEHVAEALGGWKSVAEDAGIAIAALYGLRVLAGLRTLTMALGGVGGAMKLLGFAAPIAALIMTAVKAREGIPLTGGDLKANPSLARGLTPAQIAAANARPERGARIFEGIPGWQRFRKAAESLTGYGSAADPQGGMLRPNQQLSDSVDAASGLYGVDRNQVRALIHAESGGRQVRSYDPKSSAFGYMQLTAGTAKDEGVDARDPGQNILGGTKHFSRALQLAGGNLAAGAAAYHDGLNSAGLAWYQAHRGDMSRFSAAGQAEGATVSRYYDAERAHDRPASGAPPPIDPAHPFASYWARAGHDLRALGARPAATSAGPGGVPSGTLLSTTGAPAAVAPIAVTSGASATVAPGSAQTGGLEAAIERIRIQVEVLHKNAPTGSAVRVSSPSSSVRVAGVRTERAMDPSMTPGGF